MYMQMQRSLTKSCYLINVKKTFSIVIMPMPMLLLLLLPIMMIIIIHKERMSLRRAVCLIFVEAIIVITTNTIRSNRCYVCAKHIHLRLFHRLYHLLLLHSTLKAKRAVKRSLLSENERVSQSLQVRVHDLLIISIITPQKAKEVIIITTTRINKK